MNLFFFIVSLVKLSTIYGGDVKKIIYDEYHLYATTTYEIYKDGKTFLVFSDPIEDFIVKEDTIIVLSRRIATFDTYVDIYVGHNRIGHFEAGAGGRYVERGANFYLIGTDFFVELKHESQEIHHTNLFAGRVFVDSLLAGYIGVTNNFAVLKPVFQQGIVILDTVFIKSDVPFQRDVFSIDSSMYFIGFDGNVYELSLENGDISLKRLYTDNDGSYYFGGIVKDSFDQKNFYLSTLDSTYVYLKTDSDVLSLLRSYDFVALDFAGYGNTVFAKSYDGLLCSIQNNVLVPQLDYSAAFYNLKRDTSGIYLVWGRYPAMINIDNPLYPDLIILDTVEVKNFLYQDTIYFYLSQEDSLFMVKSEMKSFIDFGVYPIFEVYGEYLYYVKNEEVIGFNTVWENQFTSLSLGDEDIFELKVYNKNIYVVSLDSSGRFLRIRKLDTLLNTISSFEIYGDGSYISPLSCEFLDSLLFIPYIRQGVDEYRISVLNIINDNFTVEFKGRGSVEGIAALSPDSVFVLERPYGMRDVKLGIINFKDSTFYEGEYIGVGGKSALISYGRFLFIYTQGKLDAFLIPHIRLKDKEPFVLMENLVTENVLNIYSILNRKRDVMVEVYDVNGRKIFNNHISLNPGENSIYIGTLVPTGLFILRLKDYSSLKDYQFKFVFTK